MESDPKIVELLQNFCSSEFGACFDALNGMKGKVVAPSPSLRPQHLYMSEHYLAAPQHLPVATRQHPL